MRRSFGLLGAVVALAVGMVLSAVLTVRAQAPDVRVSPIEAVFTQRSFSTTYTVLSVAPEGTQLRFDWSGADCGAFAPVPGEPNSFLWQHPHPPCDPTTSHADRTIVVVVTAPGLVFRCTYQGAESGVGPPCTVQSVTVRPSASATLPSGVAGSLVTVVSAPVATTPVNSEPAGGGIPLWLGLVGVPVIIAGGYIAYRRTRTQRDSDLRWEQLKLREDAAQRRLEAELARIQSAVNNGVLAYRKAMD